MLSQGADESQNRKKGIVNQCRLVKEIYLMLAKLKRIRIVWNTNFK